jgi:hypothetical protein
MQSEWPIDEMCFVEFKVNDSYILSEARVVSVGEKWVTVEVIDQQRTYVFDHTLPYRDIRNNERVDGALPRLRTRAEVAVMKLQKEIISELDMIYIAKAMYDPVVLRALKRRVLGVGFNEVARKA